VVRLLRSLRFVPCAALFLLQPGAEPTGGGSFFLCQQRNRAWSVAAFRGATRPLPLEESMK
jgi:hypothetical protein